jgi:DNA-binding GntR family transcriptional regulator
MIATTKMPVVRASLADLVYDRLLDDILSGALPSGATLKIADLAKILDVSPSPAREAVLRLAAEGLVTSPTNRSATIVSFTERDVADIFQVREFLESGAAGLAAGLVDDRAVAEIRQAVEDCAALYGDPTQKKATLDLDNKFHILIAQASRNQALVGEIVRVNRRVRVMQWLRLDATSLKQAYEEHLAVVDALQRRDREAAAAAMTAHIRAAGKLVIEGMRASTRGEPSGGNP